MPRDGAEILSTRDCGWFSKCEPNARLRILFEWAKTKVTILGVPKRVFLQFHLTEIANRLARVGGGTRKS